MPCIRLDLASLRTEQDLHAALKQALGFPDFYGANFAALVDSPVDATHTKARAMRRWLDEIFQLSVCHHRSQDTV